MDYTTFDTLSELHKIAALHPGFKCVLRIRADDPEARVPLGLKYGADVVEAPQLLATAKQLGLNVVGVSFHVGSACQNLAAFSDAIANARKVRGRQRGSRARADECTLVVGKGGARRPGQPAA